MVKKYELTEEKIEYLGKTLFRIKATRSFGDVKKGETGGFIEKEINLSHDKNAWVYDNAYVWGNARILGNAKISGNALVSGCANIYGDARIDEYAIIQDNANVCDYAMVSGCANIYGDARIRGKAKAYGDATVGGKANIYDEAIVSVGALVDSEDDVLWASNIGSRYDDTTFFKDDDDNISVVCGCFHGNIEQFEKAVHETHKGNKYEKEYMLAIELAKLKILGED